MACDKRALMAARYHRLLAEGVCVYCGAGERAPSRVTGRMLLSCDRCAEQRRKTKKRRYWEAKGQPVPVRAPRGTAPVPGDKSTRQIEAQLAALEAQARAKRRPLAVAS